MLLTSFFFLSVFLYFFAAFFYSLPYSYFYTSWRASSNSSSDESSSLLFLGQYIFMHALMIPYVPRRRKRAVTNIFVYRGFMKEKPNPIDVDRVCMDTMHRLASVNRVRQLNLEANIMTKKNVRSPISCTNIKEYDCRRINQAPSAWLFSLKKPWLN